MSLKTKLQLFFGFILTIIIVYFSVKTLGNLHPTKIFHSNINWLLVIISIVIFMFANYIRGLAYTRGVDRNIDRLTAFQIIGIGHAANMVLPLHAGEGLRYVFFPSDYSAFRRAHLLIVPAYGDFVAIMVMSVLCLPFAGFTDKNLVRVIWILTILSILGCIVAITAVLLIPKLHENFKNYLNFASVKMMFWIVLSWILLLMSTWFGLLAFGFDLTLATRLALAIFASTNVINFIPASPGAIGLFEYGVILGVSGLGVSKSTALAVGLLLHFIQYMALVPMAVVLFFLALHGKYGEEIKKHWHKKADNAH